MCGFVLGKLRVSAPDRKFDTSALIITCSKCVTIHGLFNDNQSNS